MWQLKSDSDLPLYLQLVSLIENKIQQGDLLAGQKLPSERKLAQLLKMNRSTVVHALELLAERGLVVKKPNSGSWVKEDKWGIFTGKQPNWRHYVSQSAFLPTSPYLDQLAEVKSHFPEQILDLATGELPIELTPTIPIPAYSWQQLLSAEKQEDDIGYLPLRQTIGQQLKQHHQINTSVEQTLITSGAQQAIFLITQCLLHPGDAIAIEAPSYFYALSLFQSAGLRIFALPMDHHGVDVEQLIALSKRQHIKMVFVNPTLQNPTGTIMPLQRREYLIHTCARLHIPIVEDDTYSRLIFEQQNLPPPLKALDRHNVLYIGSLSKIMGSMTRLGWLIGPVAIVKRLARARQEMEFALSIFPQVLAQFALNDPGFEPHIERLRQQLKLRAATLANALTQQFNFNLPAGGFHLWCQFKTDQINPRYFELLLQQKVLVMPAMLFGVKQPAMRLSFVRSTPEQIEQAAEIIKSQLFD